jgi:predicted unusual protein kinase regulating ubiquinone biosynthesis (AarF/ABC1/UbiB family)
LFLAALLLYSDFFENPNNNTRIVLLDDSTSKKNDTALLLLLVENDDDDDDKTCSSWLAWWRQKWQDIVQWLQETWHACWNVVFLILRGTEIVLRLSPLIILTPASILAESLWYDFPHHPHTGNNSKNNNNNNNNNTVMIVTTDKNTTATSRMTLSKDTSDTANVVANWTWWYFLQQMTALGPCFIKLVQWAASRRDLFPAPACRRMGRLHDQAIQSIHDWTFTHQALVDAFGPNYAESLKIDYDHRHHTQVLIGCGSAAQVYKGRLISYNNINNNRGDDNNNNNNNNTLPATPTTTIVAVKVLHPQLKQRMERDLRFLQILAESLHDYTPTLGGLRDLVQMMNLPRVCQNFGAVLAPQTDLRVEARHLQTFRHNFYKRPRDEQESSIKFPRPIPGWIHSNVLVEEWVQDGVPIAEFLRQENNDDDTTNKDKIQVRKELAGTLLRAFFKMIFLDNFVRVVSSA